MAVTSADMRKYYSAYETMRRTRHGFHSPKKKLVEELLEKYRLEYEGHPLTPLTSEERYKKYTAHVQSVNDLIDEENEQKEAVQSDDKAYQRSVKRMDDFFAWRKHSYLKTGSRKRPKKKLHSEKDFKKDLDVLSSLEAFVKGVFHIRLNELEDEHFIYGNRVGTEENINDFDEWVFGDGSYSEKEQYQRMMALLSIGQIGDPQKKKWAAYKASRKFAQAITQYTDCFLYYLEKKKLKTAKNEFLPPARMMVHESVRVQKDGEFKSYKKPYVSEPHFDKDLVSNLAKVLQYFDENDISPTQVNAIFKDIGGPSRIFRTVNAKNS